MSTHPKHQPPYSDITTLLQSESEQRGRTDTDEPLVIVPLVDEEGALKGYFLPVAGANSPVEPADTIDSTLAPQEDITGFPTTILAQSAAETLTPRTTMTLPSQSSREIRITNCISAVFLCLIALFTLSMILYTSFATATITITPREYRVSETLSIHLVTGVPTSPSQVEARRLSPITLVSSLSTQATGSYHQQPTFALGYLTFYNGSFSSVTIQGGSQFTGADGIRVITTQTATVPGIDQSANPPSLGQATIPSQAQNKGAAGNIPPGDITETCQQCGPSILVKNTQAFSGGQDAKTFTIVRQVDIDSMKAPLSTSLEYSMRSAITGELHTGEALLAHPCTLAFHTNYKAGDVADHVTLTGSDTCTDSLAYPQESARAAFISLAQTTSPRTHFTFLKSPDVHITEGVLTPIPTISAIVNATFVYRFTQEEEEHISSSLAGKSQSRADLTLRQTVGIAKAEISGIPFGWPLPSDTTRIIIRFWY